MSTGETDSAPIIRADTVRQISPHVHVIPDPGVRGIPNVGIVVGSRRMLVIDTGMGERNGAIALWAARAIGGDRPIMLVTTHVHPEHDLGAHAFPSDTLMIRATAQAEEIRDDGMRVADDFRERSGAFRALLEGARFRDADVTFDRRLALDLGGVSVRLTAMGANHTRGDTVALVVEDRVLFSGDVVMMGAPAFASPRSSVSGWLESLDELEGLAPGTIVPSHGPLGDVRMIAAYRAHLAGVRRRVNELRASGVGDDEAVKVVRAERAGDFGDADRLEGAIRAALREADGAGARDTPTTNGEDDDR